MLLTTKKRRFSQKKAKFAFLKTQKTRNSLIFNDLRNFICEYSNLGYMALKSRKTLTVNDKTARKY